MKNLLRFFPLIFAQLLASKDADLHPVYRGSSVSGFNPIFIPRHKKFKGYMRENRKCTFNKNR
jgi:hypothetical protein